MIELVRHIEILLLENDCVVVPGFGGFITHYVPASWSNEENIFFPPVRTIGFNPQLKMNDGILVQSYMEAYNTDFSDATKILEQAVGELVEALHKEGEIDLANIGRLSLSIHGYYVFSPYNDEIISPRFYGLDSFEIKEVKALQQSPVKKGTMPRLEKATKRTYEIRINRTLVRNAVAAVAAVILFFYMSAPIENTYVESGNYAQLLPADLFGKIEQHSLLTASIATTNETIESQPEVTANHSLETIEQEKVKVPVVVKEVKVAKTEPQNAGKAQEAAHATSKRHYIIVASVTFKDDAHTIVSELKQQGYPDACILAGSERIRVSIGSYGTREEADRRLTEVRKNNAYKDAWLLVR